MKNTFLIIAIILMGITPIFSQSTAEDDNENGTSLVPIMLDAAPVIDEIEKEGLEIVRMEIDIVTTKKTTSRVLHSDWSYGIAVVGDYRFIDMDVKVYQMIDGSWELIQEDTDDDKAAVVIVKPTETAEYMIEIIGAEHAEGYSGGHYALLIFHE